MYTKEFATREVTNLHHRVGFAHALIIIVEVEVVQVLLLVVVMIYTIPDIFLFLFLQSKLNFRDPRGNKLTYT